MLFTRNWGIKGIILILVIGKRCREFVARKVRGKTYSG
jgi:hypothetical protein